MIRKVALVHALREAFPSTYGLLYDESEINVVAESTARELDNPALPSRRIRKPAAPTKPAVEILPDSPAGSEADSTSDDPFAEGEAL